MRHFLSITASIAVALFLVVACGGQEDPPKTVILSVDKPQLTFESEAVQQTIAITCNDSWTISVAEGSDWLAVSPKQGNGNGSITLVAAANTGADRTATVTVYAADKQVGIAVAQKEQKATVWSLSQVRALYKGVDVKITDKVVVQATVISNYLHTDNGGLNNATSMKAVVVSDATAGIQLYCAENNTAFLQGDKVEILLQGQTLSVYSNGPLQVNGIPTEHIHKIGTETLTAKEITAAQLLSGAYESMYVAIPSVQVIDEDLNNTFVMNSEHTSIGMMAQTGETFDIFSSKYSSFKNVNVPRGCGVLKGIAGVFKDRYQISLAYVTDVEGLDGERFYTEPTFALHTAQKELSGEAGAFSVSLATNVDWSVTSSDPVNFAVSPARGSGTDAVTVTYTQNPSSATPRNADLVFTTTDEAIAGKTLIMHITQSPYEALVSDVVCSWLELPAITPAEGFAYVSHMTTVRGVGVRNYSFWYDSANRLSAWVAYPLYTNIMGGGGRSDEWAYNPKVPKRYQPSLFYSFGGATYDRGHQLPSADRLSSLATNAATFYFTNITAQNASLNQNLWSNLEINVRNWAQACDTLYVVTGALIQTPEDKTVEYISDNNGDQVAVPKMYYKALLKYKTGNTENSGYSAIAFRYKNQDYSQETIALSDALSIDQMEAYTGIDFFHNLPDEIEIAVEGAIVPGDWGF